jgi:hypothetical protein
MPPLTGIVSASGLQLPLPRRSLGVEFWHKGKTDQYYMLIPRTAAVPCTARQVFTTLHDNQEQVRRAGYSACRARVQCMQGQGQDHTC